MRNFIIRVGSLLCIGIFGMAGGIYVQKHFPIIKQQIDLTKDPLITEADKVFEDLSRGVSTLANCTWLKKEQPKYYLSNLKVLLEFDSAAYSIVYQNHYQ